MSAQTIEDVDLEALLGDVVRCMAVEDELPCTRPATWILSWTCGCRDLVCDRHLAMERNEAAQALAVRCPQHDCFTRIIGWERI